MNKDNSKYKNENENWKNLSPSRQGFFFLFLGVMKNRAGDEK